MLNKATSILIFAGLDPTGGAGIQADIETLSSLQVHALPIVTCLTVQDTHNVSRIETIDIAIMEQQLEVLLSDIQPDAIKLGLLSSVEIVHLVAKTIKNIQADIPIIFDPILRAGGGAELISGNNNIEQIISAMQEKIIPLSTVITPNSLEARLLTSQQDLKNCAETLLKIGCKHVFITGEHENNPDEIINTLYSKNKPHEFKWQRLAHQYHGSGCTLASALTAFLVQGNSVEEAIVKSQKYTDTALRQAVKLGQGQYHPNRLKT